MEVPEMTLRMELENLDGLDESISKLYVERDGKYVLDVEAHHDKNAKDKGNTIPKARLDQEIDKRKKAEESLNQIADQLREDVPEDFKEVIPDLPPGQLITWIRSANAKGLFDPKTKDGPDSKRPGDKKPEDLSGLSPQQMMAKGYKT